MNDDIIHAIQTRTAASLEGKGPAFLAGYVVAHEAVAKARAGDFLLREIEARTTELLESRQRVERAKRELANARAAVIQGAWTNGTRANMLDLDAAVAALMAGASA